MSDRLVTPEVSHEATHEASDEGNSEVREDKEDKEEVPVDARRVAKLEQLANARISAKHKKRQREEDMVEMKAKLDSLLAGTKTEPVAIETEKLEPAAPVNPVKRQRITKEPEEEESPPTQTDDQDHWSTSLIRTSAVLSLGAASWWMQNRYGTKQPTPAAAPPVLQKKGQTAPAPMLPVKAKTRNSLIGRSGFVS